MKKFIAVLLVCVAFIAGYLSHPFNQDSFIAALELWEDDGIVTIVCPDGNLYCHSVQ